MDFTANLIQVLLALAAVVALVLVCAFAARRLMGGVQGGGNQIRVLAVKPLGSRERLVLVDVGGEVSLLGVTQQQITPLGAVTGVSTQAPAQPAAFAATLQRFMGKGD
ncbi:MAG: flagellar biosynthetic protein FliO [Pseudomonadota bacterium]